LAKMATVQESEAAMISDLSDFLEAELDFVNQYQEILEDLKTEWGSMYVKSLPSAQPKSFAEVMPTRSAATPPHLLRGLVRNRRQRSAERLSRARYPFRRYPAR
jgi:hypothetical protein